MRNNFELPRAEPFFVFEEDDEPLPIDPAVIIELIRQINDHWNKYNEAKQLEKIADLEEQRTALLVAYQQLDSFKGQLRDPTLPDDLKSELEFELSFSCNHLHKVIKFPTE